jgi:putative ABC transport system permease protein
VLRRDVGPPRIGALLAVIPAVVALGTVIVVTLDDWRLSQWFTLSLCGAALALAALGAALVRLTATVRRAGARQWRYGLASLSRRRVESVAQIVAFGLAFMLLLVLAALRRDLVDDWRRLLPQNPPNYFFVNIPSADKDAFRDQITALGGHPERMLPMVRGRLASINDTPVEDRAPGGDPRRGDGAGPANEAGRGDGEAGRAGGAQGRGGRGGGLAEREQNLTWAAELGNDNRIVAGRWWTDADAGKPLVSLATEFQEQLGLKLGDRLTFTIAGETLTVTVASFREVKWDSFRPNFFIVFPPGLLDGAAGTYMTSAVYTPRVAGDLAQLVQRYPSVSVFNVGDLLSQVRAILDKAVTAVQSVFVFTLLAGLTVLLAAVQASRDERRSEAAILRVLGAQRRTLVQNVLVEFGALGLLAGLLAASGAAFSSFYLARILELEYRFNVLAWAGGVAMGTVIVALSGWLAMRTVLDQPPRAALG